MSSFPQISVVIPTYNRARIVGKAIGSVLAQTCPAAEIIVVNDGSKDNTQDILAGYGNRITAITQQNGGLSAARNTGIRAAKTEWVAFLDDDDEFTSDRLAIAVETIAMHPSVDVHATNTAIINEDGSELDMFGIRKREAGEHMRVERPLSWVLGGCFFAQTLVARKHVIEEVGMFRKTFYEDMDLFVRLAARGPWTVDSRRSLRLQRLAEEDLNLSSVWRSKPVENYEALTRIHREALAIPDLLQMERRFVSGGLATNLFELGRALHARGDVSKASECFREAAGLYPRPHSRIKAHLAATFGTPALWLLSRVRRRSGVFRSKPATS